jgi:pSer/pThr/pTyr-binding forkhead associated (FHA) protein
MKAQLVIVEGKQKGKTIDLSGPSFLIGRGETCHLRPVSELVSREHAEFVLKGDVLFVRDLGSRNGTLVNGKALTTAQTLKDGDMVQVGPLVFTVSIHDGKRRGKASSSDEASDATEVASEGEATGDEASEGHGGSTIMIPAFKRPPAVPKPKAKAKTKPKLPPTKTDSTSEGKGASEIMKKMLERRKPKA